MGKYKAWGTGYRIKGPLTITEKGYRCHQRPANVHQTPGKCVKNHAKETSGETSDWHYC